MDERKIYFGIEKKFWFLTGILALFGFVGSLPIMLENQSVIDWSFYTVVSVLFGGMLISMGWVMTKENTSLIDKVRALDADQEQIEQSSRDQLHSFVTKFDPVGEIVLEGDFPYLSASFNDQDGKRREILTAAGSRAAAICRK